MKKKRRWSKVVSVRILLVVLALATAGCMAKAAMADSPVQFTAAKAYHHWSVADAGSEETVIGRESGVYVGNPAREMWDGMKAEALLHANAAVQVAAVPVDGVRSMELDTAAVGVILERTDGGDIALDVVGAVEPDDIALDYHLDGDVLRVTASGLNRSERCYVSTLPDRVVNAVRIRVPEGALDALTIRDQAGTYRMAEVAWNVSGDTDMGEMKVVGDELNAAYRLSCGNGTIHIACTTLTSTASLETRNGGCVIEAGSVQSAEMTTANGDLMLRAETVQQASMQCANGDLQAEIAHIGERLSARCKNGDLHIRFVKDPENLRVSFKQGNGDAVLPEGWGDGFQLGNGEAVLELESGNGDVFVDVAVKESVYVAEDVNSDVQ